LDEKDVLGVGGAKKTGTLCIRTFLANRSFRFTDRFSKTATAAVFKTLHICAQPRGERPGAGRSRRRARLVSDTTARPRTWGRAQPKAVPSDQRLQRAATTSRYNIRTCDAGWRGGPPVRATVASFINMLNFGGPWTIVNFFLSSKVLIFVPLV
jgi:hypothetical protein